MIFTLMHSILKTGVDYTNLKLRVSYYSKYYSPAAKSYYLLLTQYTQHQVSVYIQEWRGDCGSCGGQPAASSQPPLGKWRAACAGK